MKVELQDIDMGYAAMSASLAKMAGALVETGLFDPEQATKGNRHEFGTSRIPARPWLSVAADTGAPKIGDAMVKATDEVIAGASPKAALERAGETTAQIAKNVLGTNQVGGPPLAASTVRRKGNDRKLVDTGAMRDAIESKVTVKA